MSKALLVSKSMEYKGQSLNLISGDEKKGYVYLHHFGTGHQQLEFPNQEAVRKWWKAECKRRDNQTK